MLKSIAAVALGTMVLASGAVSPAGADQVRNIRLSNGVTKEHPNGKGVEAFAACLGERSGGKMKVQDFWGGALGFDLQAIQALRSGTQEMAVTATSVLTGIIPAYGVFDLPYLFESDTEAAAVLDGEFGQWLAAKLPAVGLIPVVNWETGFRNVTNSKRPIFKLEDLSGLKIRLQQSPVFLDSFRLLGVNPVAMSFGEVYAALETGAIDGQENAYAQIDSSGIADVQKYVSATNHAFGIHLLLFSKAIFDRYSPEEQKIILECGKASSDVQRAANRAANATSLENLKRKGLSVNAVAPEEIARLREKTRPIYEQYTDKIGKDTIERANTAIKAARGN